MDNLFEYLIFIFFIVSILNGIFGKKKRKAQSQSNKARPKPAPRATSVKREASKDLIEQLFGIPLPQDKNKTGHSPEIPETKFSKETSIRDKSWNPEVEFESNNEPATVEVKKVLQNYKEKYETEKLKSKEKASKFIRASEKYQESEVLKPKITNERKNRLIKNIRNPETIRDLIVVQELLNKPIALRD